MEVLVTGGAGYLGRHLITALQARGDSVRALILPGEDTTWLEKRDVCLNVGDVRQPETLRTAARGADGIFHLAAMTGVWRPMRDYYAVNVTGTENVCMAALDAGVPRLVHVSSAIVYPVLARQTITETTPLAPLREQYPLSKAEGDRAVQRMVLRYGLPAVIVRPGSIYGPGDRVNFERTAERLRAGKGLVIGSGGNAVSFVYITDVVQGLLLALDQKCAPGQIYNITNDQFVSQQELLWAIAEGVGTRPPRIHVPYRALYALALVAEQIATVTGYRRPPFLTRIGVQIFGADTRHSIDKARRELGYAPRVRLHEGVRVASEWYLKAREPALSNAGVPAGAG